MSILQLNHLRQRLNRLPAWRVGEPRRVAVGIEAVDRLLPTDGLARGAVHEVLSESTPEGAVSFAMLLLRAASAGGGMGVWCDPRRALYPPALAAQHVDSGRLVLLRPRNRAEEVWAIVECLRCKGVSAVVAMPPRLSNVEARRLQLAAERGGSVGLLLRSADVKSRPYAAATRWRVEPAPGNESVRRWKVELVHGHGGRVGESVLLEVCRETNLMRAAESLVDRSTQTPPARVTA